MALKRRLKWFAIKATHFASGEKNLCKLFANEENLLQVACKCFASSAQTCYALVEQQFAITC